MDASERGAGIPDGPGGHGDDPVPKASPGQPPELEDALASLSNYYVVNLTSSDEITGWTSDRSDLYSDELVEDMTALALSSGKKSGRIGSQFYRLTTLNGKKQLIVLDEPTAMLDPGGRREVIEAAHGLNQVEGITILLITHYMEEAIGADRVIVMDQGKVAMEGTPREVFSHVEELRSLKLDVPEATMLAYKLQKAGLPLPNGILTKKELADALAKTGLFPEMTADKTPAGTADPSADKTSAGTADKSEDQM